MVSLTNMMHLAKKMTTDTPTISRRSFEFPPIGLQKGRQKEGNVIKLEI